MHGRKGALAVGVEARRRVRRDHVSKYTAVFRRLVGHRWHCRHQGDAQDGRPERWCHRFPPVRLGRVARPIASSYSENTKMPIVLGPKTGLGGPSARLTHPLSPIRSNRGIFAAELENNGFLHIRAGSLSYRQGRLRGISYVAVACDERLLRVRERPTGCAPRRAGTSFWKVTGLEFHNGASVGACQSSDRVPPRTGTPDRWALRNRCLLRVDSR